MNRSQRDNFQRYLKENRRDPPVADLKRRMRWSRTPTAERQQCFHHTPPRLVAIWLYAAVKRTLGSVDTAAGFSLLHGQKCRSSKSPIMARHGRVPDLPCSDSR
jgi:hypothetical protein